MKVVYIGASDGLAEVLSERLVQEGDDVYILSDKELPRKHKGIALHRFYRSPRKGESFGKLVRSIAPDCVIFAGKHYMDGVSGEDSDEDLTLLARTLRAAAAFSQVKFVLLSSTEVYGNTKEAADESAELASLSERGMRFVREEKLVDMYREARGLDTVILRASHLYANTAKEGGGDFLSRSYTAAVQAKSPMIADVFQPLHVSDFVDAIKKVVEAGTHGVYNVSGSNQISEKQLYQLIRTQERLPEVDTEWINPEGVTVADSGLIRSELGWQDRMNVEAQLPAGEIVYERAEAEKKEKKPLIPKPLRQFLENVVIFIVFFALSLMASNHDLFAQIDLLLIYVILISVAYNVYQSALAAVFASAAYLYIQNFQTLTLNTFNSYADNVLAIMEFIFLGLLVSYTTSRLREDNRNVRVDLEMLQEEYDDLKAVNDENVLIKNEYEERLLSSKSGFPRLYSMVSRLMVEDPDRILMETMQIVSELMHTKTVAVYQGQEESSWLRLVGALSEDSVIAGKSWNLAEVPRIYDAVMKGELYQGEFGSTEPAAVLPIMIGGDAFAVLVIKSLPYESESLYHVNLLKTLSLLLRDAMEKAFQYEELSRDAHYVQGSDVLKPEAFAARVSLASEMEEKGIADYCIIKLNYSGSFEDAARIASHAMRTTDCLGIDTVGNLFALLRNTSTDNLGHLQERLSAYGIQIQLVQDNSAMHVDNETLV